MSLYFEWIYLKFCLGLLKETSALKDCWQNFAGSLYMNITNEYSDILVYAIVKNWNSVSYFIVLLDPSIIVLLNGNSHGLIDTG